MSRQDHNQHDAELARLRARVAELESNKKDKKAEQRRDIAIALAFTAGPFGFGVPILYSCISWAVAWMAFVHLILNLEYLAHVSNAKKIAGTLIATAVFILATYSPIHVAYIKEKAAALSGDLIAHDDGNDHTSDPPRIQIGDGGTVFVVAAKGENNFMQVHSDKVAVERVKGRLLISTTVRDRSGNMVAEVFKNHWTVSSSKANCWDKNYTDDALEVRDGRGRILLQVRVTPYAVQLQAQWFDSPALDPQEKGTSLIEDGRYDEVNGIHPMFRYPSDLFWGQLTGLYH